MSKIHILHEHGAWVEPLRAALTDLGAPFEEWFVDGGVADLASTPPEGVFYNRVSASSHTRDHRFAPEWAVSVLSWLEAHGRRVLNGTAAVDLEISKIRQYGGLAAAGLPTPRSVAVSGPIDRIVQAARDHFGNSELILKPNRGGKGLGVRLFADADALADHLQTAPADEQPIDGIWLLQQAIRPAEPIITRAEFIGGKFLYAVEVDTSDGFELCPADACEIPGGRPKFKIAESVDRAWTDRIERFLAGVPIDFAGVEFIRDASGAPHIYDVNTNTNYNSDAEAAAGFAGTEKAGMRALARVLVDELAAQSRKAA